MKSTASTPPRPPLRPPAHPTTWNRISGSLTRLLIWTTLLATWEAAFRAVGWRSWVFPAPSTIADGLLDLLNVQTRFGEPLRHGWPWPRAVRPGPHPSIWTSSLLTALSVSGQRLAVGFGIGVVIGGLLGVAMWRVRSVNNFLGPLFLGLQTLPSVCWVPLAILAIGFDERAIQFVLVMGSFTSFALALRDGLRNLPPLYRRAGLMLGARGWRLYGYVLLPASLPAVTGGLRQGFGFAWRSLMGGEFVLAADRHGLGFVLSSARTNNAVGQVVGIMAVMVVIGMAADRLVFAPLQAWVSRRFGLTGGA